MGGMLFIIVILLKFLISLIMLIFGRFEMLRWYWEIVFIVVILRVFLMMFRLLIFLMKVLMEGLFMELVYF